MTAAPDPPRIFTLTLVATGPGDPYHGIKALLKLALRRYGLRCTMARELPPVKSGEKPPKPVASGPQITSQST